MILNNAVRGGGVINSIIDRTEMGRYGSADKVMG
jgi:hypothetical protein